MNSNTFRLAALAVAAAPVALLVAAPAHAGGAATRTTGDGKASAVVLRTALDVSLLNKTIDVPLRATLNEVQAPADAKKTALSVRLDGVEGGRPVSVLSADVATSRATVDKHRAEGYSNVVKARVHVPGLPALSLVEVEKVTSRAVCATGRKPVAESNVLGHVTVLGKRVELTASGTTRVDVPGIGDVTLDLSRTSTTSNTAAATALRLKVSVNPLKLNVADVRGEVTLVEATCRTPRTTDPGGSDGGTSNGGTSNGGTTDGGTSNGGSGNGGSGTGGSGSGGADGGTSGGGSDNGGTGDGGASSGGSGDGGASGSGGSTAGSTSGTTGGDVKPQTGTGSESATGGDLAETGSSSTTPYIAGGAAVLLAAGAGATVLARRRARG
ncbi:SCO1860 family LAETG-anchored protein [Streptomyces sp. NPDC002466]|uniref:SCO1860 family LAETG-anchored protein n=1 Tax=unclassified Streptomyces TaxID=2593676 RepID=UPI0011E87453|nr:SCO1860 family LAETG-anchored protein [Streptomyces sp. sk2.1]TXS77992.1 LPXTG cell wall anchor domain-containing protein [Streptomyces sp. sk2.1]